ncbi:MAG TPA: hypothetical protein VN765_14290, partial [Candidatus Acidoferrum sp.]|nr:hypothetical protein [Candidatus Acidoferrum sp.]
MHTPAAALAWELWRRHRLRLIAIAGLVLFFALLYPALCTLAGFNPGSPDALEEMVKRAGLMDHTGASLQRVVQVLYLLFLACGPAVAMVLSLLFVTWMFTFTEFDPRTKDPMTFPARLFTLPVSTPFLFWWLFLGGMTAIIVLYGCWVYWVPQPHVDIFGVYQNCFGWMTLLALAQGIVWALAAWPRTRIVVLMALLFCFLGSPAQREIFESPFVLPPLFVLGMALAGAGLQKMRHGQWQGWAWPWPFAWWSGRAEMRGPKRFASPAQAQLWFEWRRFARRLSFYAAGLALLPVAIHLLVRFVAGWGPLQPDTVLGFVIYLLFMPPALHFCFAVAPPQTDLPFVMNRPLSNGGMMMAALKAAGIGALVSGVAVLAALWLVPWVGTPTFGVGQAFIDLPQHRMIIVLGLTILSWRLIAVSLGFTWSGKRWLAKMPVWLMLMAYLGGATLAMLAADDATWNSFWRLVPGLLVCLVVVKFLLAFLAFRLSLKRGLLAPSALQACLAVWALLAATLFIPAAILFHDQP